MAEGDERSVPHPGESLKAEIRALGISPTALARRLGVPASRITDIINCRRGISADSALRLARYFGTSPRFWLELQTSYDLARAERRNGAGIRRTVKPLFTLRAPHRR